MKITDYAQELLTDLDSLEHWPERVKTMQRNWIGKSKGTDIVFDLVTQTGERIDSIKVFTTRPDTLFGVTYVSMACEHPLINTLASYAKDPAKVESFVQETLAASAIDRADETKPKTGEWLGVYAVNPINGENVPLYVADYVLMDYGTGVVMAVPAHDQRDFEFAKAHNLPVKVVITPQDEQLDASQLEAAFTEPGYMINSGDFTGKESNATKELITQQLEVLTKGGASVQYRLRDWLISRQRYWGTPIPMAYDAQGQPHPVTKADLPVELPTDVVFDGKGNPLASSESFKYVDINGEKCVRETDTMDTFFDSSWYFLRYCDAQNNALPFDQQKADYWMNVDQYIGGIEHAVLHLLYARFLPKHVEIVAWLILTSRFNVYYAKAWC